ncbi:hypothetical protein EX30DRAFT_33653 [Ascodesmis nigricans]|uniref:Uncharacterized protein n=1 Tax=Ascodesmis nigricans TaxID=341454 RepID=A0A4S2MWH6_9PEZI|nr:hypothetical protein EX30DRAFT_33653 [Ascodesmis nigricans]
MTFLCCLLIFVLVRQFSRVSFHVRKLSFRTHTLRVCNTLGIYYQGGEKEKEKGKSWFRIFFLLFVFLCWLFYHGFHRIKIGHTTRGCRS